VQSTPNGPSPVRATAPTANGGGVPSQGPTAPGKPQFQFHRPAPPAPATQSNPVGPTGAPSSGAPTNTAPVTTSPSTSGTGE
jgi:outer membrane protein assembly factor BamE